MDAPYNALTYLRIPLRTLARTLGRTFVDNFALLLVIQRP